MRSQINSFIEKCGVGQPTRDWLSLLTDARKLRREWDLWRDFRDVKKQIGSYIGRSYSPVVPGRRALFFSIEGNIFQLKVELLFAKSLQLKGYDVAFATSRRHRQIIRYCKLFNIRLYYFEDYEDKSEQKKYVSRIPPSELSPPYDFPRLMKLKIGGIHLGQHVLSTYLVAFQQSHLDLSSPVLEKFINTTLLDATAKIPSAIRLMDEAKPDIVVFLEKGYLPNAIYFDLALERRLNVIQWCGAQETDAYVLKKYGLINRKDHPFSLSEDTWNKVLEMPWTQEMDDEFMAMIKDRYENDTWYNRNKLRAKVTIRTGDEVRQLFGLEPHKKTAVVFSHILWDATFFYGENLFDDYEKWLVATIQAACANKRLNWIIKLHPDYVWKLRRGGGKLHEPAMVKQLFGDLPNHVKLMMPDTDISTYSLFAITDYCVTVRGTIGIEMASFGIPVITAGNGRYSHLGFTHDSKSPADYLEKLANLEKIPRMTEAQIILARKFAYALFRLRPLKLQSVRCEFRDSSQIKHPLFVNGVYHFEGHEELVNANDLRAFAQWATDWTQVDYLRDIPTLSEAPCVSPGMLCT